MEYHCFSILSINTLVENGNAFLSTNQYIHSKAKADNNVSKYWYLERRQVGGNERLLV